MSIKLWQNLTLPKFFSIFQARYMSVFQCRLSNNVSEGLPFKKLGNGKNGAIYKWTGSDYPYDNLNPKRFKEEVAESELKKLEKDNLKIKEMLAQVDDVLSSFKALL